MSALGYFLRSVLSNLTLLEGERPTIAGTKAPRRPERGAEVELSE